MRLLLAPCALITVFLATSAGGQQHVLASNFHAPRLSSEPTLATADANHKTMEDETIVQPFEETESHALPEVEVPLCQTNMVAKPAAQHMPPRRIYRRFYIHSDPHQVEYYSPNLPYYDPAHGYNSYRPLPANSRYYRGPANRHDTGWGFSY